MLRSNVFLFLLITWRVVSLAWEYIALKNHVMSKKFVSHFIPDFLFSSTFHCSFKFIFTSKLFSLFTLNSYIVGWLSYSRWVWSVYSGDRRTQILIVEHLIPNIIEKLILLNTVGHFISGYVKSP